MRLNIASPRNVIAKALEQIKGACDKYLGSSLLPTDF
jgi:bifunctional pyridoxal-dependent enzyme with beta-cystathionase and maltose regulon repressor activities